MENHWIHPIQIEYINDIFTPKKAEVEDYEIMIAKKRS